MKVTIHSLRDTDLERVAALRRHTYGDNSTVSDAEWQSIVWRWLGTHPLADRMHRWVLTTEDGEVVGHLAALPQFYRIGGERVIAHTPADYQVLQGYGFHALPLMRRFFRSAENYVSCDAAPAVISVETRLGAEEVGRLKFAAKVLDVAGVPNLGNVIPKPLLHLLNWGLRTVDGVLNISASVDNSMVEVLDEFDESFDDLFESIAAAVPCLPEKDAAFLRWRYGPYSPQYPVTILGVKSGKTLLGYAVLRVTRDGDSGYLLDLTTRPRRHDVARALLKEAVRQFARSGVYTIKYLFLESPTSPRAKDVWRLGFFLRDRRAPTLLVKFADRGLHKTALNSANWSYGIGDGEATFWIR